MPDFSIIVQDPYVRDLVQDNALERAFHDALFPEQLFRSEVVAKAWPAGGGDTVVFTADGLLQPDSEPIAPRTDPTPMQSSAEQWEAVMRRYTGTMDVDMPTSMVAIADFFVRSMQRLGMQAAQSLNRKVRNRMYNAALSGWTVADGAQSGTTLRVKRLNGFTRARNPLLSSGSQVRFSQVSSSNPLTITVFDNGAEATFQVIGYTPDTLGDEIGPGTLTLLSGTTSVSDRAYVKSIDRTSIVRAGGGDKVDAISSSDVATLSTLRSAVTRMRSMNVSRHQDGYYHGHMSPNSEARFYEDGEFQRLNQSLPDYYMYKQFTLGVILNTALITNSECPTVATVRGGDTATFSVKDDFAGELYNTGATTGTPIERILLTGPELCFEMCQDLAGLISEAGVTGKVVEPKISNNSIEVFTDRVQMVMRAPLNRLQDQVALTWQLIGDWPVRTDACSGDAARYKRCVVIEHA
jgi:hypothetical protein